MLKTLATAIHKIIDEAPYSVRVNKSGYEVVDASTVVFTSRLHDQAEDMMDSFNDAWIARKVVEAMRDLNLKWNSVYDKHSWKEYMNEILKLE